jgi:nitrite reductase (NADH) small subunit/3-phenylpropionate/trans-cinnamate dioxygenase ferredoxin subunit
MAWTDLCRASELTEGEGRFVDLGEHQLAVFLVEGQVHAFQDTCPHAGASLAGGMIEEGCVVCPWHYWTFNLTDGTMASGGRAHIKIYSTRITGEGADAVVQADI